MKEFSLKINHNKKFLSVLNLKGKITLKKIKLFLKSKFHIKKKFFFTYNGNLLHNNDIISLKSIKKNSVIELKTLNNRIRVGIYKNNKKILKSVAKFFQYFLKVDVQFFDTIMNTIKYSNPNLFKFILSKKKTFINMIFSKIKEKNTFRWTDEPKLKEFFDSFQNIFLRKKNGFKLRKLKNSELAEDSRNISSLYYYDDYNSKSSNISNNSNSEINFSSPYYREELIVQNSMNFNVIENKYQFFEDFGNKINNFLMI